MSRTLELPFYNDEFKRFIGVSVILHVSIVLLFTLKAVFFPDEKFEYQSAVKVDLVALPDKIEALPAQEVSKPVAEEKAPPTPAPTPPPVKKLVEKQPKKQIDRDAINLESSKKRERAALDKMKQMNALEEIENQEREEARRKAIEKLKQIKGNALSAGTELKGVAKLQHDNYLSIVEKHIRQNWALPEWMKNKNLSAQIRVRFDEGGNITSREIAKSSGNPTFDELVMLTVQKSSPVPPPPSKFVKILNVEGILLGFPE